jgi:hypothetical protein
MSKNRPTSSPAYDAPTGARRGRAGLGLGVRIVVSLLLLWHVAAVFIAGLSVPGSSRLAGVIGQYYMQWYLDALAMNRGHHFFAPDTPTGSLIQFEVVDAKGSATVGEFPKKKDYWPRLRYHRYLMLADQSNLGIEEERLNNEWTTKFLSAYAFQLMRELDGQRVRIRRVVHDVLPPPLARRPEEQQMALNDPKTYRVHLEIVKNRSDLEMEERRQLDMSAGWTSGGRR